MYLMFACALALAACSKEKTAVNCSNNFNLSSEVINELNAINSAAAAYANDQSNANCQNLKNAYQDYIDALRDLETCARQAGVLQEWNQSLNDAEDSIDTIC